MGTLALATAAYGGTDFVAARPPKAGLWESTISSSAHFPSDELAATMRQALSVSGFFVSDNRTDATMTEVTEQVCWTETALQRASSKSDTELALRAIAPETPCEKDEPLPGNVTLFCRVDAEHGTVHGYSQRLIDTNTFTTEERFYIVKVKDPNTRVMEWQMKMVSRWLGPDCKAKK